MKAVIQRVKSASVVVNSTNQTVGKINQGIFVLLGIKKGDTKDNADFLAKKLTAMRIIADEERKMNYSLLDKKLPMLLVSQFTLYANTKDGNRPSFIEAEEPKKANELYLYFVEKLKGLGVHVETGSFGNYMEINANLDGPVTIILES